MEYKPTTLPQYWPIKSRQDFNQVTVQSGHVLLFSQDGQSITAKLSDGSFVVFNGSGGIISSGGAGGADIDVTLGYVSGGTFYQLGFTGTSSVQTASSTGLSFYSWNLPIVAGNVIIRNGPEGPVLSAASRMSNVTLQNNMYVYEQGIAVSTTVNSGGWMDVYSGGTATNSVENGGYVYVADGAEVTFTPNAFSGLMLSSAAATVHSGTTAVSAVITSGGSMLVYPGGVVNSLVVSSGCYLYGGINGNTMMDPYIITEMQASPGVRLCFDVSTATYIQGTSAGSAFIISSGIVNDAYTIASGNSLWLYPQCSAENLTVESGGSVRINRATLNSTVISSDASLRTINQATLTNITVLSGGKLSLYVGASTYIQGTSAGSAFIISSGIVSNYTVASGNSLTITSDCTASSTVINAGGYLSVEKGGIAQAFGGTAVSTIVKPGGMLRVGSASIADYVTVSSGGRLTVSAGGTATNITSQTGAVITGDGTINIIN